MKYDIITIGAASVDVFLQSSAFKVSPNKNFANGEEIAVALGSKLEVSDLHLDTGGGATNAAATFGNFGMRVACVCRVGEDFFAHGILKDLKKYRVDTNQVIVDHKEKTGLSTILLTDSGERTILAYRGASHAFTTSDVKSRAGLAPWVYISSLGDKKLTAVRVAIERSYVAGQKVVWNPGAAELSASKTLLFPLLKKVSVLHVNAEEARMLTGKKQAKNAELIQALRELGPKLVVMTDGPRGAYAFEGTTNFAIKPTKIKAKNRTGAGDAFCSGFTAGLVAGKDVEFCLRLGTANAESVISHTGAKRGLLHAIPTSASLAQYKIIKK